MPLKKCSSGDATGWQWGDTNTCQVGTDAKRNAVKQAIAMGEGKFTDMGQFDISRSVFMFDIFDHYSSEEMIKQLMTMDQEKPGEPINIFINSYGGEVLSLFAILDTMAGLNSQVNTICLGEADSCGAVLLSAGDFRYIGKNSRSMIHEVSAFSWGKVTEMEDQIKLAKEVNDRLIGILAKNMNHDFTMLKDIMKNDTWLDAKATKDMGLVDFVMEENLFDIFKDTFANLTDIKMVYTNSANGRSSDGVVTKLLYDVIKKGGVLDSSPTVIDKTKGDVSMNKEEMFKELKDKYQVDVTSAMTDLTTAQAEVLSVKAENETLKVDNAKLTKEIVDGQEAQVKKEIEDLLSALIEDKKSTQVLNDTVYRVAFTAMGVEQAKLAAKNLVKIVKDEQDGVGSVNEDDEKTEAHLDMKAIEAIQAATAGMSYGDAARKFYSERKES